MENPSPQMNDDAEPVTYLAGLLKSEYTRGTAPFLVPPSLRNEEDILGTVDLLKRYPALASLPDHDIRKLVEVATFLRLEAGTILFNQGDFPDAYYILLAGRIALTKSNSVDTIPLLPGMGFGELGLLRNVPRAGTCTASEPTHLLRLRKDHYLDLYEPQHKLDLEDRFTFIEQVPLLMYLSREQKERMAEFLLRQRFPRNSVIVREGAEASNMYFVKEGEVAVVRTLIIGGEPRFLELSRLAAGDYFGEWELVEGCTRRASIIALAPTECLVLSRIDFPSLITGRALELMRRHVAMFPSDNEVLMAYRDQKRWNDYKRSLTQEIVQRKVERRHCLPAT
ncbi:putative CGMP-dependent kinase 9-1 [Paratrimastix pyriformis]|uniref:cGMP-dependent kinase 9-1 n=1 Tax=Paratrimastix pyriformis TaxID=342808 RepID=A0ABQ8UIA7_9EUKA|nr:putative CGMP-dependent kinase 9-1 [Paratrimastix pyriformis]